MKLGSSSSGKAFTLLEMMLSIAVFLLLVASAFSLVGATTELMTEISEVQNESSVSHRFIDTCRSAFESTTIDSGLDFYYYDRGGKAFDTYLILENAPSAFDFGTNLQDQITRIALAAEIRPDGLIRTGVYYLNDADFELGKESSFQDLDSPYVELIPRMRQLTWRFYDEQRKEWAPTLEGDLSTSLIELTIQTEGDKNPIRSVFYCINSQ